MEDRIIIDPASKWQKIIKFRKRGQYYGQMDIYVKNPSGTHLFRSSRELANYIKENNLFGQINTKIINFEHKYSTDEDIAKRKRAKELDKFNQKEGQYQPKFLELRVRSESHDHQEAQLAPPTPPYSPPQEDDDHRERLEKQRKRVEDQIKKSQHLPQQRQEQPAAEPRQPIKRKITGLPQNTRQDSIMKKPKPTNLVQEIMSGMDKTLGIHQHNQESRVEKFPMRKPEVVQIKPQVNQPQIGENDKPSQEPRVKDSEEWFHCLKTYFSTVCAYYSKMELEKNTSQTLSTKMKSIEELYSE